MYDLYVKSRPGGHRAAVSIAVPYLWCRSGRTFEELGRAERHGGLLRSRFGVGHLYNYRPETSELSEYRIPVAMQDRDGDHRVRVGKLPRADDLVQFYAGFAGDVSQDIELGFQAIKSDRDPRHAALAPEKHFGRYFRMRGTNQIKNNAYGQKFSGPYSILICGVPSLMSVLSSGSATLVVRRSISACK